MSSPDREAHGIQENGNIQDENGVGPPKPPRSAFVCFSDAKRDDVMRRHDLKNKKDCIEILAEAWRQLSHSDRAFWDEEARNDKVRYVREKAAYKGPWVVPKRRAKKHPLAPKRPMSAFLKFSQKRRATVKDRNPDMSNTDVSRLLGEMWRNASQAERAPYVIQEELERAAYKVEILKWREEQAKLDADCRSSHREVVHDAGDSKATSRSPDDLVSLEHLREPAPFAPFENPDRVVHDDPAVQRMHDPRDIAVQRMHDPRDVFRTYPARLYSQPRADEDHAIRQESFYPHSYRFNGYYRHDPLPRSYRPQQQLDPLSLSAEFDEADRTVDGLRLPQTANMRDNHVYQSYSGRNNKYTPGHGGSRPYGTYQHP